jgi:nucleoside-diphosphate-sugar epimerase
MFHHRTGVSTVAARLFNIYGRNETNTHLIPAILEQVEDGGSYVELRNLSPRGTSSTPRTWPAASKPC